MAGLRERKKERVRMAIQREALRLFLEQGFEQTTVEQIAEAADVSPATFYRYYTSKEDSVVTDGYDPSFIQSILERPADEPLVESLRAVFSGVTEYFDRDREILIARHVLAKQTPAVQAAQREDYERSIQLFSALLARHIRRSPDDLDVRIAVGALTGAMHEAFTLWLEQGAKGGSARIRAILDRVITRCAGSLEF
jgi:AcrR family transcriptional regulator